MLRRATSIIALALLVALGPAAARQTAASPQMAGAPQTAASPAASPQTAGAPTRAAATAAVAIGRLIGQKLVVRMDGTAPSAALLERVRRGEVGGVILFRSNIVSRAQLASATTALHAAARAGGQPALLVMVDQEGGSVRTVPWAPPTMSARQMGLAGSSATARRQGAAAGAALHAAGIDVDLAPVVDVPSTRKSFMYLAGRTFGFGAATVARLANAFAAGVHASGVVTLRKHFPGIGRAARNTDRAVVTVGASWTALGRDLAPFRAGIANGVPLIMLSNATYTAYDPANAAGWSHAVATTLLRTRLGFRGVSITDSLTGTAAARGVSPSTLAVRAARAGTDMILVTGSEAASQLTYEALVAEATAGRLPLALLRASYARILSLKAHR